MSCLTRFETKSARVKGIAFHPKRPWVLSSLHNGNIQLWDYRMCTLIEKFDEHEGPVRGVDFHSNQPIFVSGGDDYKIKVWNYKTKRCLFTLLGHVDYIRTTFFHKEYPWIISASDDQTIRIWNWQSRNAICVLTGHSHYVMCAQFHPSEDLVVSASLDQTVRVWDISGLRKKTIVPMTHQGLEDNVRGVINNSSYSGTTELFGTSDGVVKHVLEGHDRGVNWAAFHPTSRVIVSAADDRQVKIWRMNGMRAWELDTCRGHFNNVSCAIFHPRGDLLLSNSEDKSIRIWDMNKRSCITTIRRESDRFWVLAAHPTSNLFAAGHDNGIIVFKLERERPAMTCYKNQLYYVKEDQLRRLDFDNNTDKSLIQLKSTQSRTKPYSLSYNSAENAILIVYRGLNTDNASYELIPLPKDSAETPTEFTNAKKPGINAVWVQRNKFAILENNGNVSLRNMSHAVVSTIDRRNVEAIFSAGIGNILIKENGNISLYDVTNKRVINTVKNIKARQIVWSSGHKYVAVLTKLFLYIFDRDLDMKTSVRENVAIKSGCWDDSGVFIYTTCTHIKYAIVNGDHGIIRTLDVPIYLAKVSNGVAYCLDRSASANLMKIDVTEYLFKLALIDKRYDEVIGMVKGAKLVGQSMIAYLQKKGYPEIALHFVKDERTRFALALECGNLKIAYDVANKLNDALCWEKLGELALLSGNYSLVEKAYQKTKNYEKLNFLYLITGNFDKLRRMMKIAESRKDYSSQYQMALLLGDVEERMKILNNVGQKSLAYLTGVTHGLNNDLVQALHTRLDAEGLSIPESDVRSSLLLPSPTIQLASGGTTDTDDNWPLLTITRDLFSEPTAEPSGGGMPGVQIDGSGLLALQADLDEADWGHDDEDDEEVGVNGDVHDEFQDAEDNGAGWDLDDNLDVCGDLDSSDNHAHLLNDDYAADTSVFVAPSAGKPPHLLWSENSSGLISHQIISGNFDQAMRYLNEQAAIVNFNPYLKIFMEISSRARLSYRAVPSSPALYTYNSQIIPSSSKPMIVPITPLKLATLLEVNLPEAYRLTTKGIFTEAVEAFRNILLKIPLLCVESKQEEHEAKHLKRTCTSYIVGISMEIARRQLPQSDIRRNLEMACYFTHCELQPSHLILTLRTAQQMLFKHKNFGQAAHMARRLLDLAPPADIAERARKIIKLSERDSTNDVDINYDARNPFSICAASYTPIYHGADKIRDTFSEAYYLPEFKGQLCRVSQVSEIGKDSYGLRIIGNHSAGQY